MEGRKQEGRRERGADCQISRFGEVYRAHGGHLDGLHELDAMQAREEEIDRAGEGGRIPEGALKVNRGGGRACT